MKPIRVLIFCCFLSAPLSAQNPPERKHALTFSLSPEFGIRVGDRPAGLEKQMLRPGYRIKAGYEYRIDSSWWLRSGISFASLHYAERYDAAKYLEGAGVVSFYGYTVIFFLKYNIFGALPILFPVGSFTKYS